MRNKNRLIFHNGPPNYSHIEIRTDDHSYENDMMFLIQIINDAAHEKKVFVVCDGIIECRNKDFIIRQQIDVKNEYRKKLWVKNDWLNHTWRFFDEVEYVGIYLFDDKYQWNSFLHQDWSNNAYILKEPQLYMMASFGQCQCPSLCIKKDFFVCEQIKKYFSKQGFKFISTFP